MTTGQKVALAESVKDTCGLNLALDTVELPKSTWYYHQKQKVDYEEKYAHLRPILEEIARNHPEYGVPRIMPELRDEYKVAVNHKVVERLLGTWDLSILRSTHRPRPSSIQRAITEAGGLANLVAQMEEIGLFQVVYTDFTELVYADGHRKAILMPQSQSLALGRQRQSSYGIVQWAVQRRKSLFALGRSEPGGVGRGGRSTNELLQHRAAAFQYRLPAARDIHRTCALGPRRMS